MADQDPPVGPLHRLDPAEPDETQELGRLEPLDPDVEDAATAEPAATPYPTRPRDGLALAVALAVLLSLSSIAAIGGLVALSVGTLDTAPEAAIAGPIEAAASGPTIRVVESAGGPDSPRDSRSRNDGAPEEPSPQGAVAPSQAPAPAQPPAPGGRGKSTDEERESGNRGGRRPWGVGGAWCDAAVGSSCDVVVGGPVARTTDGEGDQGSGESGLDANGFLRTDDEGEDLDDEDHHPHGKAGKHG